MLVRSYADWCFPKGPPIYLEEMEGLPITDMSFLMHVGGKGSPQCLFVQSLDAGARYIFKGQKCTFELKGEVARSVYKKCLDRKSIVFFKAGGTAPIAYKVPVLAKLSAQ